MDRNYDPETVSFLSFTTRRPGFLAGTATPRSYLEEALYNIDQFEPDVRAFVEIESSAARRAADASTQRWQMDQPVSAIDGIIFGVKDCFHVEGLPTRVNSAFFASAAPESADSAHVWALRLGGGNFVGKTTTTEWTMALPPPTWNPWDLNRTPGGSSAGSAAAVAAGMLSIASGSQVRGSGIRPASICGVPALKPTFGALNRHGGVDPTPSLNHLVLIGASLSDIWAAAKQIADLAGGDPGVAPMVAGRELPAPRRPLRLARQYTSGWDKTDLASQEAFERWLGSLSACGVEIVEPQASAALQEYEQATAGILSWFFDQFWEMNFVMQPLLQHHSEKFSPLMRSHIERAGNLSADDYRSALLSREKLKTAHRAISADVDGFVTLAHIGPGQIGQPELGTPWYNDASSAIGAPTMNLPVLAVDNLPLGVQLMGFEHGDQDLMAMGRWVIEQTNPRLSGTEV